MSFLRKVFIILFALVGSVPHIFACTDSTTYRFTTVAEGIQQQRSCKWLTGKPSKEAARKAKFCPMLSNGFRVKDQCRSTCDTCAEPTSAPVPTTTSSPVKVPSNECTDSTSFQFETPIANGRLVTRRCTWLTFKPNKAIVRTDKYCSKLFDGIRVEDQCKLSCEKCSTPTSAPVPTTITNSPAQVPSNECTDSTSFKFRTPKANGLLATRRCTWLTFKPNKATVRTDKYCSELFDGIRVEDQCKLSCDTCGAPTRLPTSSPTKQPTPAPAPPTTSSPVRAPSSVCTDSSSFTFKTPNQQGVLKTRRCTWLTQKNAAYRTLFYCDDDVTNGCPFSCDECPSPIPSFLPSEHPSKNPTDNPTLPPVPTQEPTRPPSPAPSPFPSARPSSSPSKTPSDAPSQIPSLNPSQFPSERPSEFPSEYPSERPSISVLPSLNPSEFPSLNPSISALPSLNPSQFPSEFPSKEPTPAVQLP